MSTPVPALAIRSATKRFGAVTALDGVDLDVHRGEVVALLGDNGAGKSTLIKCISGAHRLDAGTIEMDGRPVTIHSPNDARTLGIETVYQDLALFDNLKATDNFYAGRELAGPVVAAAVAAHPAPPPMAEATREVLARLEGLAAAPRHDGRAACPAASGRRSRSAAPPPSRRTWSSSTSRRPRSALRESRGVLELIRRLRDGGRAVIVISHALDHVMEVADRAVVMRRGRKVGELPASPEAHAQHRLADRGRWRTERRLNAARTIVDPGAARVGRPERFRRRRTHKRIHSEGARNDEIANLADSVRGRSGSARCRLDRRRRGTLAPAQTHAQAVVKLGMITKFPVGFYYDAAGRGEEVRQADARREGPLRPGKERDRRRG